MITLIHTAYQLGFDSYFVDVECDSTNSLPGINIVGMANKSVDESKDRIRGAIRNSKLQLPPKKFTLNLAPAHLPKQGTLFDLPMAIAILTCTGQIDAKLLSNSYFFGELSLDGSVKPISGILGPVMKIANEKPKALIYIPEKNVEEASLVEDANIVPVKNLSSLYRHLIKEATIPPVKSPPRQTSSTSPEIDLSEIADQKHAKRALEVAAAGGHNILLNGPPGSGKTMLAKALVGILPPLSSEETIETTLLHSLAGVNRHKAVSSRPFRSPHHTASTTSLVGGGRFPQPGEISLSHNGVLFLDELPEYSRQAVESLRQPLEDKHISIARTELQTTFPADFMLIATQNPCPCGYATDKKRECTCSAHEIRRYLKKVSGPLFDRIDMVIEVPRIDNKKLLETKNRPPETPKVANRIKSVRQTQRNRNQSAKLNASLSARQIKQNGYLTSNAQELLEEAASSLNLSARAVIKTLRVSRTIADLSNSSQIKSKHVAEALQYRRKPFTITT